jgi:hypothetical protein
MASFTLPGSVPFSTNAIIVGNKLSTLHLAQEVKVNVKPIKINAVIIFFINFLVSFFLKPFV